MELDNELTVDNGEQSVANSPDQETLTGLETKESYGLKDGELFAIEDSEEEQPPVVEKPVVPTAPVKTYKVKYGTEELEVPETELLNGYMRQTDFTRKTQELALERDRLRQELEQSRQRTQAPVPVVPQETEVNATKIIEGLVTRATQSAMATLGITDQEEFDHWNPVHKTAYDLAMNNLVDTFRREESRIQTVRNFETNLQSQDQEYSNIRDFAVANLKYLPQYEHSRFQEGFARGDTEIMNELYTKMKKAYNIYNGKEVAEAPVAPAPAPSVQERSKVVPPTIESGKGTPPAPVKPQRDYSALRGMTFDEQIRQMKEWGVKA